MHTFSNPLFNLMRFSNGCCCMITAHYNLWKNFFTLWAVALMLLPLTLPCFNLLRPWMNSQLLTFCTHVFGLFCWKSPQWTLANEHVESHKDDKAPITCLAGCNRNESERVLFMIILKRKCPLLFRKKSGIELGFTYHCNPKFRITPLMI